MKRKVLQRKFDKSIKVTTGIGCYLEAIFPAYAKDQPRHAVLTNDVEYGLSGIKKLFVCFMC